MTKVEPNLDVLKNTIEIGGVIEELFDTDKKECRIYLETIINKLLEYNDKETIINILNKV